MLILLTYWLLLFMFKQSTDCFKFNNVYYYIIFLMIFMSSVVYSVKNERISIKKQW